MTNRRCWPLTLALLLAAMLTAGAAHHAHATAERQTRDGEAQAARLARRFMEQAKALEAVWRQERQRTTEGDRADG